MTNRLAHIGRSLPPRPSVSDRPDWMQANPARIDRALEVALRRPTGGWYVLDASDRVAGSSPTAFVVEGQELVAWRDGAALRVAPASCPHMGADLTGGCVSRGRLVCPWHGVHYHPHSFARLRLLDVDDDVLTLRVSYRVAGPVCVEVDATFHSPDPRTITMTIIDGEGVGSVVETHATPVGPGRSRIIEATIATSDRPGFRVATIARRYIRAIIEKRAGRLWVEDTEYAERRYALRTKSAGPKTKRRLEAVE